MGKRIQKVSLKELEKVLLKLGFVGENEHTQIVIDCAEIFTDYPAATYVLAVASPHDDLYPGTLTKDGNDLKWQIADSDLVSPGTGEIQLTFYNGDEVIKSFIARTWINDSITATGDIPEPLEDWLQTAEQTEQRMEAASESIEEMTVAAQAGSPVGAEITEIDGKKHIEFTIPSATVTAIAGDDYAINM